MSDELDEEVKDFVTNPKISVKTEDDDNDTVIELKKQLEVLRKKIDKKKNKKTKITTTKKVLFLVLVIWTSCVIFSAVSWLIKGTFPEELMDSVNIVAVPTILSYAAKSGFEFITRAKNGASFSTDPTAT